jgi:hypothetical protein
MWKRELLSESVFIPVENEEDFGKINSDTVGISCLMDTIRLL